MMTSGNLKAFDKDIKEAIRKLDRPKKKVKTRYTLAIVIDQQEEYNGSWFSRPEGPIEWSHVADFNSMNKALRASVDLHKAAEQVLQ